MSERTMGENEPLYGPSKLFGGAKISFADIMQGGMIKPQPVNWDLQYKRDSADAPPFKKGDRVVQIEGPQQSRNARPCIVDYVRYVKDGKFEGWAIKLVGREKPYAANLFRLIGREVQFEATPAEQEPVGVAYSAELQAYEISIDGIRSGFVTKAALESGDVASIERCLSWAPTRLLNDIMRKLWDALGRRVDVPLHYGAPAVPQQPAAPSLPFADARAPMAPAPRRRIIRPKKAT